MCQSHKQKCELQPRCESLCEIGFCEPSSALEIHPALRAGRGSARGLACGSAWAEVKLGGAGDVSPRWSSLLTPSDFSGSVLSLPGRTLGRADVSGPRNHLFLFSLSKPSWGLFAYLISIFPIWVLSNLKQGNSNQRKSWSQKNDNREIGP